MQLISKSLGLGVKPALIVVDMTRGFTDPQSPLGAECTEVKTAINRLLEQFRAKSLPIHFTSVVYSNDEQARVFRDKLPALNILKKGSQWVEIDPVLNHKDTEPVIVKHWASGFFATDLAEQLRAQQVDSLVVTGLTTSGCVRATAVDGLQHNFRVVVPKEASEDRNQAAHQANLYDLNAKYVDVLSLDDVLMLLAAIAPAE